MIIGSTIKLPDEVIVGKTDRAIITDENYQEHRVVFKVIREATFEDYLNQCREKNVLHKVNHSIVDSYFYEVEILD